MAESIRIFALKVSSFYWIAVKSFRTFGLQNLFFLLIIEFLPQDMFDLEIKRTIPILHHGEKADHLFQRGARA